MPNGRNRNRPHDYYYHYYWTSIRAAQLFRVGRSQKEIQNGIKESVHLLVSYSWLLITTVQAHVDNIVDNNIIVDIKMKTAAGCR